MTFDEFQKNWRSQPTGFKLTIDSSLLLKQVRRNQRNFEAAIFWRDVRESGGSFLLFFVFLYIVFKYSYWLMIFMALACLFVGTFIIIDRAIQRKKQAKPGESLKSCIESALAKVNHQIWMLKNVFWWYILPFVIGFTIVYGSALWKTVVLFIEGCSGRVFVQTLGMALGTGLLCWGIYHLNQWAVRKELIPRRQELEQLLAELVGSNNTVEG